MKRNLQLVLAGLLLLPLLASAHGPTPVKLIKEIEVNAPPEKVWGIIKDYCAIEKWHPAVYKCESTDGNNKGSMRTLVLEKEGGPVLKEQLVVWDDAKMKYKYRIKERPLDVLPVNSYLSEISVRPDGKGGSIVKWWGRFYRGWMKNDPPPELNEEAAKKAVSGVYDAGLASIKKLAEQ